MVPSIFYFSKRFITKGRNLESCNFLYISHRCWEKSANRVFGYKRFKISIDCIRLLIKTFFQFFQIQKIVQKNGLNRTKDNSTHTVYQSPQISLSIVQLYHSLRIGMGGHGS